MPSAFQRRPRALPTASASPGEASSSSGSTSPSPTSAAERVQLGPAPVSHRAPTHPTLRPSPFPQQQPLPLFSLGLHAINDVLTGVGLPSASLALFLPVQPTPAGHYAASAQEEESRRSTEAGAAYADLIVKYGAAQGVAARQKVLVVGEEAHDWVKGLMGWSGAGVEKQKSPLAKETGAATGGGGTVAHESSKASSFSTSAEAGTNADDDDDDEAARSHTISAKDSQLKVAFRYEKLKRLEEQGNRALGVGSFNTHGQTTSGEGENVPYVHPFDLSMKMPSSILEEATLEGRLVVHGLRDQGQEENTYNFVWSIIKRQVAAWRASEEERRRQWASSSQDQGGLSSSPPSQTPIRIVLPSLGSPAWVVLRGESHSVESYRLLLRIKKLLRSSSWIGNFPQKAQDNSSNGIPASHSDLEVPIISLCSPSAYFLSSAGKWGDADAATRLSTIADSVLAFSSFSSDPRLRSVFQPNTPENSSSATTGAKLATFTGALQILKTPALGSLAPSSIRASQLRGLSSSAGSGGSGGSSGGDGGSGGENALGFKVRRKGIKVEVLGRDLVADWGAGDEDKKKKKKEQVTRPLLPAPQSQSQAQAIITTRSGAQRGAQDPQRKAGYIAISDPPLPPSTKTSSVPVPVPQLKGLAALRARGARASVSPSSSATLGPSPATLRQNLQQLTLQEQHQHQHQKEQIQEQEEEQKETELHSNHRQKLKVARLAAEQTW